MTRVLLRRAPTAVIATLAAAGVLLFAPIDATLTVRIYLLVIGALALLTLVGATGFAAGRSGSRFERALVRPRRRARRPEELEQLERQVLLAVENAADFHFRLRPALVAAVDAALWRLHGVDLALQPERAAELLPPALWDVVRPDLPPPADRRGPGPPLERLDDLVTVIERMAP